MIRQTYRVFFFDDNDQFQEGTDQIWLENEAVDHIENSERSNMVVKIITHDGIVWEK